MCATHISSSPINSPPSAPAQEALVVPPQLVWSQSRSKQGKPHCREKKIPESSVVYITKQTEQIALEGEAGSSPPSWAVLPSPRDAFTPGWSVAGHPGRKRVERGTLSHPSCGLAIDILLWKRIHKLESSQAGTGPRLCPCLPICSLFLPGLPFLPQFRKKAASQSIACEIWCVWAQFGTSQPLFELQMLFFLQKDVLGCSRIRAPKPAQVHVFKYPVKAEIQSRDTGLV